MVAFRIEKTDGTGVAEDFMYLFAGMPNLDEDFTVSQLAKFAAPVCAFPSRQMLLARFDRRSLRTVLTAGYTIRPYFVSDYAVGASGQQVIFNREVA